MSTDYLATCPPEASLTTLPNLGRVLVARLATVGIRTVGELRAVGEEAAWRKVRAALPADACISSRLALAGACRGVRWHTLPQELRARLSAEVRAGG
jgi:DNA transformation protein